MTDGLCGPQDEGSSIPRTPDLFPSRMNSQFVFLLGVGGKVTHESDSRLSGNGTVSCRMGRYPVKQILLYLLRVQSFDCQDRQEVSIFGVPLSDKNRPPVRNQIVGSVRLVLKRSLVKKVKD